MGRILARVALTIALIAPAALAHGQTSVDRPSAAVQGAIVAVIQSQLQAFQRDDGAAAFSYASPTIRAKFGTAEIFMAMVRGGYAAVYRPREVQFLEARVIQGRTGQAVRFVGPEGQAVIAVYWMERQPGGGWRINGVIFVPANESYS